MRKRNENRIMLKNRRIILDTLSEPDCPIEKMFGLFAEWLTENYAVVKKSYGTAACTKKIEYPDKEQLLADFFAYLDGESKETERATPYTLQEECKQCGSLLTNNNGNSRLCDKCLAEVDTTAFTKWLVKGEKIAGFLDNIDDINRISKSLDDLKSEKDAGNWASCCTLNGKPMYSSYADFVCSITEKIDETEEDLQCCLLKNRLIWEQYCEECNVPEESIDKQAEIEQAKKFYNEYID